MPGVACGCGRDGGPAWGSVTSCLPDIFQAPQQDALALFVLVEIDLVQVERELQFGELGANLALVMELGIELLLDHAANHSTPRMGPRMGEVRVLPRRL